MKMELSGNRRTFLKTAAAFCGCALCFFLGGRADTAPVQSPPARPAEGARGYRLTEHVKRYYQTARI